MLSNPSQLLERHLQRLAGRLLLVNPPADQLLGRLPHLTKVVALSQRYDDLAALRRAAEDETEVQFGATLTKHRQFDHAVVFASKEKALTDYNVALSASCLGPAGSAWLVGENRAGARSAGRLMDAHFDQVSKLDSARHCTLFSATEPTCGEFDSNTYRSIVEVTVDGLQFDVASWPGVFSHGRLDAGTELLLRHLPNQLGSHGLDYGCGNGVIAAFVLLSGRAAAMDLVDTDALALTAAQATMDRHQLSARLVAGDSLAAAARGYDVIISNPPFHRGVATHYAATERMLEQAPNHLRPGGQLLLVANAFLDYPRRLSKAFGNLETLADDGRFRVYRSRREGPRSAR